MDNLNNLGQNDDWFEGAQRVVNSSTPIRETQINTNISGGAPHTSTSQNTELRQNLVNSYMAMGQVAAGGENISVQQGTAVAKKKISVFMVVAAVELAVILAAGILAIIFIPKWLGDPEADAEHQLQITQAVEGVQARVNVVYADASKTSLKEGYSSVILDDIRLDLYALPEGADASGVEAEMLSISKFNSDDIFLKQFENEGYNVASDFVLSACNYVQTDMLTYTVSGLQTTMKTRVNALLNERALYYKLLSELQSVDVKAGDFDSEGYKGKVQALTHTLNKTELLAYIDMLVAKINSSKASAELSELRRNVHGEIDEETQKKIDAAQDKFDAAKEVVVTMETAYTKAKEDANNALTTQLLIEVLPSTGNTQVGTEGGNTSNSVNSTVSETEGTNSSSESSVSGVSSGGNSEASSTSTAGEASSVSTSGISSSTTEGSGNALEDM